MNQAYSRLSTTHGHITSCKLDSVVYAGVCVGILMWACLVWAKRSKPDNFWVPSHRFFLRPAIGGATSTFKLLNPSILRWSSIYDHNFLAESVVLNFRDHCARYLGEQSQGDRRALVTRYGDQILIHRDEEIRAGIGAEIWGQ